MDKDVIHTFMYTHTHIMKYYSAIKNNAICSNMDGSKYYHTKWNKPEREYK